MMTMRAGRLTPKASVGVAVMTLIFPSLKAFSMSLLCAPPSPAWWYAVPLWTK